MTTDISFTFEHDGFTYEYVGKHTGGKILEIVGDLDGHTTNCTFDTEKNEVEVTEFGCGYRTLNYEAYGSPYEDMNQDDLDEVEIDYRCELHSAFEDALLDWRHD